MGKKLTFLLLVVFLVISCGVECDIYTGNTINMDMSTFPLSGEYKGKYNDMEMNISNDSIAVITFKDNRNTYELTYKIDTIGKYYETAEEKIIN